MIRINYNAKSIEDAIAAYRECLSQGVPCGGVVMAPSIPKPVKPIPPFTVREGETLEEAESRLMDAYRALTGKQRYRMDKGQLEHAATLPSEEDRLLYRVTCLQSLINGLERGETEGDDVGGGDASDNIPPDKGGDPFT